MARILFSGPVDSMAGKIAGSVIQNSYGGYQLRTRVIPRNPQVIKQQTSRNALAAPSAVWRSLSGSDQTSWRDAATPTVKGFHLFVSSNKNIQLLDLPALTTYEDSAYPDSMSLSISLPKWNEFLIDINGLSGNVPSGQSILIAATRQKQPGQMFFSPTSFIPIHEIEEGGDLTSPFDMAGSYGSAITALKPGYTVAFQISLINYLNGLRSEKTTATTLVTS
jgi:hypothetical protein